MTCSKCSKDITSDEKALYQKLMGKLKTDYLCIECMAAHFKVSPDVLREKIEVYRKMGCALFDSK